MIWWGDRGRSRHFNFYWINKQVNELRAVWGFNFCSSWKKKNSSPEFCSYGDIDWYNRKTNQRSGRKQSRWKCPAPWVQISTGYISTATSLELSWCRAFPPPPFHLVVSSWVKKCLRSKPSNTPHPVSNGIKASVDRMEYWLKPQMGRGW